MEALTRSPWNPARRCSALNRSGEQCARQPIPGGSVCVLHGGSSPQAQAAAKTRLLAMVEPVLATFEEILAAWHRTTCVGCGRVDENGVKCVGCGKPTGDASPVIRIGQLVLDRAGFHPSVTVEHAAAPPNEFENMTPEELEQHALRLVEAARHLRRAEQFALAPCGADSVDGGLEAEDGFIVVPDDDEPIHLDSVQIPLANAMPDESKEDK